MMIAAIIVAIVAAFLAFRFVAGLVKLGLLALIIILALWFLAGGTLGMSLAGGVR
jgi:hypothetical protein